MEGRREERLKKLKTKKRKKGRSGVSFLGKKKKERRELRREKRENEEERNIGKVGGTENHVRRKGRPLYSYPLPLFLFLSSHSRACCMYTCFREGENRGRRAEGGQMKLK